MARTADDVRRLPAGEGHRLPPHNLEAEASVLGAMLLSNEAVADVVEILEPDDFYRSAHGRIYTALRGLFARGEPVDIVSAAVALERDGSLDDIGGALYLADLANEVPTPASAAYYAEIVSKAALRRRLISAAADIMERAYASTDDAEAGRRRRRAAHLRGRPARGPRRDGGAPRPRRPGDARPRVDPDPRVGVHRPADRVHRHRQPHVGPAARQPDRARRPPGHGQELARGQHGAQHRGGRATRSRSSPSRCRAGRSACACSAPRRACRGIASATSVSGPTTGRRWCRRPRCCTTPRCRSSTRATRTSSTSGPRRGACARPSAGSR